MKSGQRKRIESFVIGLDCSTTATKAIVFDRKGKIAAHTHETIPPSSPKPHHYEQDPNDWWTSACKALRSVTRHLRPERIAALAISNQRETFVPIDKEGRCLRPAIIWLDERCKDEVGPFSRRIGQSTIHRITGKPPDYAPVVYRLAWMKKHEPELYHRIGTVCDVHTYMVWRLTNAFNTSWASADPLGMFDLRKKEWSRKILSALELDESQLPTAHCPGTILGSVLKEASHFTGLRAGTLVVAGGGDGQAAGLGANALVPERAYLNLGTAVVAGVYGKRYRTSKAFRTMTSCSESGYYYECSLRAGTLALDWFMKNILKTSPARLPALRKQLELEARRIPVGSDGLLFLPYLCGVMNPYWDVNARGAFIGLSSFHNRTHMYRSILEGIAFEQMLAITAVETSIGTRVKEFATIGGGATNALWCQILADVTGRDIRIPETNEASALGAGIAAAVGAGWYRTFKHAAARMARTKEDIYPNKKNQQAYRTFFAAYKRLYPSLKAGIKSV
jgi:sugar (pentulose or hexulose) kinase